MPTRAQGGPLPRARRPAVKISLTPRARYAALVERLEAASGAAADMYGCPSCGSQDNLHVWLDDKGLGVKCFTVGCAVQGVASLEAALDAYEGTSEDAPEPPGTPADFVVTDDALDNLARYCGVERSAVEGLPVEDGGKGEYVVVFPSGARKRRHWTGRAKYTWDADVKPRPVWPVDAQMPEEAWFTEGETDCIVLRSLGIAAYSLGSASDSAGVEVWEALRSRGLKRAVIAGDADEAGREATAKRMRDALAAGLRVASVVPPGYDPLTGAHKDWRAWHLDGETDVPEPTGTGVVLTMDEYLAAHEGDRVEWAVEGIAAFGTVSMLAGPMKGGKTTLMENAFRLVGGTEDAFLGRWSVAEGLEAALFTEEGAITVRQNMGHLPIHVVSRRDRIPSRWSLAEAVSEALDWASERPRALVVFDTYDKWAGIKDENAVGENVAAIETFYALAEAGAAVLLAHHSRKGGGEYGEGIRGSGAILGAVDHAVELKYVSPTSDRRHLEMHGRLVENSRRLLDFDRETMTYSLVDEADEYADDMLAKASLVPSKAEDPDGVNNAALNALWDSKDGKRTRDKLLEMGYLVRSDELVKVGRGQEWRYWRATLPVIKFTRPSEATDGQ
ncbi:MAG: hypothetical protein C0498_01670 [Anaerolinea sp.]|nr:hypothetical protein [Anaerolinea sp.]